MSAFVFTANAALWVGVTVLVLVASLPAPGRRPVLGLLLTFVAALIVGSAAVHYRIGAERLMMPSPISERARYAHKKLANPQEKNVLVVDGGSFAARAINNGLLTLTLARMGYSTRVVHLGITASNHFERYALYQRVVQNLEGRKRKKGQRWLYLAEVHRGYDVSPLAQFERNRDTERAYDYMSAAAAWLALRASFTPSVHFDENPWFLRFEVLRHALIHCFSVGSSALMVPASKVERHDGHIGRPAERGRAFFGLDPLLKELSLKDDLEVPPWVFEIREREEERLWGPYIDRWIYFGVPSTYPAQLRYIRTFCSRTKRFCLQPANREMLSQLNSKKYWADEGHLSHAGSKVYTLWLANQLVRTGALKH